jgi:hypothetical protein
MSNRILGKHGMESTCGFPDCLSLVVPVNGPRLSLTDFSCAKHVCRHDGCLKPHAQTTALIFCTIHECEKRTCYNHRQETSSWCHDHECRVEGCFLEVLLKEVDGELGRNCVMHTCHEVRCLQTAVVGANMGFKYCLEH